VILTIIAILVILPILVILWYLQVSGKIRVRLGLRLGLGLWFLSFTFSSFLPSLLHSILAVALLLRYRWRMNKFSNFKIHRPICSHCHKNNPDDNTTMNHAFWTRYYNQ